MAGMLAVIALGLTGCPHQTSLMKSIRPMPDPAALQPYRALVVDVRPDPAQALSEDDAMRLVEAILAAVERADPDRFSSAGPVGTSGAASGTTVLLADIEVTRYRTSAANIAASEGGFGEIRIDGIVRLKDAPSDTVLATYVVADELPQEVRYEQAAATSEVERGFADSVATVILGRASS